MSIEPVHTPVCSPQSNGIAETGSVPTSRQRAWPYTNIFYFGCDLFVNQVVREADDRLELGVYMKKQFVIEFTDRKSKCIRANFVFSCADEDLLCHVISPGDQEILDQCVYDISRREMESMRQTLGIDCTEPFSDADDVTLRIARPSDALPYKVHTNRELLLMLAGSKPMSVFSERYPITSGAEIIPESVFDPYVEDGKFIKREFVDFHRLNGRGRFVYYARPSEAWRIDAHILMLWTTAKSGWSEGFERMEGSLLGYEEWQNDVFLEKIHNSQR